MARLSINKAILAGRTGRDPEIKETAFGDKLATFSLATDKRWKNKNTGEYESKATWHKIVVYNQHLVNVARDRIKKGTLIYVEGEIEERTWETNSGEKRSIKEIVLGKYEGIIKIIDDSKGSDGEDYTDIPEKKDHEDRDDLDLSDDGGQDLPF